MQTLWVCQPGGGRQISREPFVHYSATGLKTGISPSTCKGLHYRFTGVIRLKEQVAPRPVLRNFKSDSDLGGLVRPGWAACNFPPTFQLLTPNLPTILGVPGIVARLLPYWEGEAPAEPGWSLATEYTSSHWDFS